MNVNCYFLIVAPVTVFGTMFQGRRLLEWLGFTADTELDLPIKVARFREAPGR